MAAYDYLTLNGLIVPDTSDLLAEVQQEYKDAFNDQNLAVTPDTPQGVLITAETLSRSGISRNNAAIANQINPNYAGGLFLDAIWALTGGQRTKSSFTSVLVDLTGQPNTLITPDVLLTSSNGDEFQISGSINLGPTGTATELFIAVQPGPIPAEIGTVNTITVGVLGLETANNSVQGTLGSLAESDDASRKRRRNTLALQGSATLISITSGLYNTPNVTSLRALENVSSSVQTISGVVMNPHSVYFSVAGGLDKDVAQSIFNKKSGGCDYTNGASMTPITVNIDGPFGVVYPVSFDRPDILYVLVRVTIRDNGIPIDISTAVKQAVLDYASGLVTDDVGLTVGTPVSSFDIAGAIKIQYPGIDIVKVEATLASLIDFSSDEIPIAVWQQAVILNSSSVTVIIL